MNLKRTPVLLLVLGALAFGQTTTPAAVTAPVPASTTASSATSLSGVTLPTYIFGGVSYDQTLGFSGVVSSVIPESNAVGLLGTVTVNFAPFKYLNPITGKTVYLLSYSARAGQFKTLYNDGKNMVVLGGDLGASFASAPNANSVSVGFSGSFSAGYFRQLSAHLGVGGIVRFLYEPSIGPAGAVTFNAVPEFGLVWKP